MDTSQDLWWTARQRSAATRESLGARLVNYVMQSLPGRPTRQTMAGINLGLIGAEKSALVIDLNKYRAGRNIQAYIDAGVDAFILRMGGPTQWRSGDWKYEEDRTWREYYAACDKAGFANRVGGYYVNNPFEDWALNGLESNVMLQNINTWTMGIPVPRCIISDHEVAECWNSVGAKIVATPYNLVNSLGATLQKAYNIWRKPMVVYTARWFVNSFAPQEHITYFDNINRPDVGKQRGLWLAWVPQNFTKEYQNMETALAELLTPNGTQTSNLLSIGSNSKADLWQFSFSLKLPGDSVGVDASVSLGSKADFFTQFGFVDTPEPPIDPPPDEPPPDDPDLTALAARVKALEDIVSAVKGVL